MPVTSIFLDMSKAFDFVNHSKLLHKLQFYGIRGKANEWLESYLNNRKQCTEITTLVTDEFGHVLRKSVRSNLLTNSIGVPQGSVLGPLLFLVYINDLPDAIPHRCILFADDTTIIIKCHKNQMQSTVMDALENIITWLDHNNLKVNINKTNLMQFNSYNSMTSPLNIKYNDESVDEVNITKFLGLNIDNHLNWKLHVDLVCARLERYVFALKRIRQNVSVDAALAAYHGYVSSVLSYGLILWGNSVEVERVFKIQKRCVRVICKAWYLDSCRPLFRNCKILPLACMYIRDICVFTKLHHVYFQKRCDVITRQKRKKFANLLYQPVCRKNIYERNVFNMCINIYNCIPDDIKLLNGQLFKNKLNDWLLQRCFYSIRELKNFINRN